MIFVINHKSKDLVSIRMWAGFNYMNCTVSNEWYMTDHHTNAWHKLLVVNVIDDQLSVEFKLTYGDSVVVTMGNVVLRKSYTT